MLITNLVSKFASNVRRPQPAAPEARRFFANQGLWLIVALVFVCSALGVGLNTNLNVGDDLATVKASRLHDQDGGRIYNEAAIAVCMIGFLAAITRLESFRRSLRVFKSPIVWAIAYQGIIAWHYWSEANTWDMARLCGVWLLLMAAMAASPAMELDRYVPKMLLLFRILLWMSLLIGFVFPDNGWQHGYVDSFLPGLTERFVGIGGHPNGMGAIAGFAILLELDRFFGDGVKRWISFIHLGLGAALLVLTQSKTSLLACAACSTYLLFSRRNRFLPNQVRVIAVATSVVAGSLFAWSFLEDWISSNEANLGDLSGRLSLWQYLWNIGVEQSWFGYGKSLWTQLFVSESFRYKWAAGNAHNQLLNSFLMAGAVGVILLILYVGGLYRQRKQINPAYRALFTSCLAFLIIRSFAEAGFEPGDLWVVGHLQTVLIGFCLCRQVGRLPGRLPLPRTAVQRRAVPLAGRQLGLAIPGLSARNPLAQRGL